jgi:endonuclease/exonuclease/phosphatase family metal-dependent hydrolase
MRDSDAEGVPLRAMTFNARVHVPEDGKDSWPERRAGVVRLVRYHRPDVVCFQELAPHQYDYVRDRLRGYEFVGVGRRDGAGNGEHVPVGYDASRLAVADHDTFWLSPSPEEAGSVGWDAAYPRIVTRAVLRVTGAAGSEADSGSESDAAVRTAPTLTVANTHFDHEGATARAESARLVRRRLATVDDPVVLLGDFNCEPDSEPYRVLAGAESAGGGDDAGAGVPGGADDDASADGDDGSADPAPAFADARDLATDGCLGPRRTFHGFTGTPSERIDHVFVRGVGVARHATLADRIDDDRYPSDHFPLVADLRLDG